MSVPDKAIGEHTEGLFNLFQRAHSRRQDYWFSGLSNIKKQRTVRYLTRGDFQTRQSLVAKTEIKAGEMFTVEYLGVKRPGDGASPMSYWDCLGCKVTCDYHPDEKVKS